MADRSVRDDERGHPCLVGLEGNGDDIAHQAGVIAQVFRQPVGRTLHGATRFLGFEAASSASFLPLRITRRVFPLRARSLGIHPSCLCRWR